MAIWRHLFSKRKCIALVVINSVLLLMWSGPLSSYRPYLRISLSNPINIRKQLSGSGSTKSCEHLNLPENIVHVVYVADDKLFVAMMTSATSILHNTQSDVMFHFVTSTSLAVNLSAILDRSRLKKSSYEVIAFFADELEGQYLARTPRKELNNPFNYARVYLPNLLPCLTRVIYLDTDTLVLGDISELFYVNIRDDHVVSLLNENNYWGNNPKYVDIVVNYSNPHVMKINMPAKTSMVNNGVFVADLDKWRRQNISEQLQYWMRLNVITPVVRYGDFGSGSQAIMILVIFDKYTPMPKEWNVLSGFHHLSPRTNKLLHWNGPWKPWNEKFKISKSLWWKYYNMSQNMLHIV